MATRKRRIRPAEIGNKMKRQQMYNKQKKEKKQLKVENKKRKLKERAELGDRAPPKQEPKSLDKMREVDITMLQPDDEEVFADMNEDEFAPYYDNLKQAKIMVTTRPRPSKQLFAFVADLLQLFPNCYFYPRKTFSLKQIVGFSEKKNFTHIIVINEKKKEANAMVVTHLPYGPTAMFKVTNIVASSSISGHGRVTDHRPEVVLNNFNTRLGLRVGRLFGSMFPHEPEFHGRQVATFHNQRDFIFVRYHRYLFEEKKARPNKTQIVSKDGKTAVQVTTQELGPRFTLKMKWLQAGTFDTKEGEFEWIHKQNEHGKNDRKRFFL
jgi:ribosome production factor 1